MKLSMLLTAAVLSAAMTSGQVFAQEIKNQTDLAGTTLAKTQATPASLSDAPPASTAAVSTISVRAIKDFRSRFTKVADEQWSHMNRGFYAYFTTDGIKTRAYYDLRGRWQASLKYCDESQLPHFIRDVVKRTYYDLAITFVNIIEVPGHTVYLVYLEDKKTLKIVRVTEEGDMDVMNEFTKQ